MPDNSAGQPNWSRQSLRPKGELSAAAECSKSQFVRAAELDMLKGIPEGEVQECFESQVSCQNILISTCLQFAAETCPEPAVTALQLIIPLSAKKRVEY
jgi:hypothetical protein